MSASRSSPLSPATAEESTPKPVSGVERAPESSRRRAERKAALLEYFANPPPEMHEIEEAWEHALRLYGDEDSDMWVSALEDGTHPLCRVRMLNRTV